MHVAVAAAHRAERRTEVRADGVKHRFAKCQPTGGVADERRENIALFQRQTERSAQGFLPAPEKSTAVNFATAVKRGQFVIQQPRQHHEAIGGKLPLMKRGCRLSRAGF